MLQSEEWKENFTNEEERKQGCETRISKNKSMEVWLCPGGTATVQAQLGGCWEASLMKRNTERRWQAN